MSYGPLFFSNDLNTLSALLQEHLFSLSEDPFQKRLVIIPHPYVKTYLLHRFAQNSAQIAAGMHIVTLLQAWKMLSEKGLPSKLELSLYLEEQIEKLLSEEPALERYLEEGVKKRRIGPFSDLLAESFLRYGVYGKQSLASWQEKLFQAALQKWSFPKKGGTKVEPGLEIFLFGFGFIPKSYFTLFQRMQAKMYLFSPCLMFWGDYYSDKERLFLQKKIPSTKQLSFQQSFEGQNRLLANLGKVGRQFFLQIQEEESLAEEYYVLKEKTSSLHLTQNDILEGAQEKRPLDDSIECFSAPTKLREIEGLKTKLIALFEKGSIEPSDVHVFAPDIGMYAPYIEVVFKEEASEIPYFIEDLRCGDYNLEAKAFAFFIELPKNRCSLEEVLLLFSLPAFRNPWGWTEENLTTIQKWLRSVRIKAGFSKEHLRYHYLESAGEKDLAACPEEGTWESGLHQLLLTLGEPFPELITNSDIELFDQLLQMIHSIEEDLAPFYDETLWPLEKWTAHFLAVFEKYFTSSQESSFYRTLQVTLKKVEGITKEKLPFLSAKRILDAILNSKNETIPSPHLQAVRFASLAQGCILPSPVICLIGMDEASFPKVEEKSSLFSKEQDYRPLAQDQHRFIFLEALLAASSKFILSYERKEATLSASSLLIELLSQFEGASIQQEPLYVKEKLEEALLEKKQERQLLSSFTNLSFKPPLVIDIQKLFQSAQNPLRYYFNQVLKAPLPFSFNHDLYLLSVFMKQKWVKSGIEKGLEATFRHAEKNKALPVNIFKPFAKKQIAEEVKQWDSALEAFGLAKEDLFTLHLHSSSTTLKKRRGKDIFHPSLLVTLETGETIELVGRLTHMSPQGMLIAQEDSLESIVSVFPQLLLMHTLQLGTLLLTKEKTRFSLEGFNETLLKNYLHYFLLSQRSPSFLTKDFAKPLLSGSLPALKTAIKAALQRQEKTFFYFTLLYPALSALDLAPLIHEKWSSYLQKLFYPLVSHYGPL